MDIPHFGFPLFRSSRHDLLQKVSVIHAKTMVAGLLLVVMNFWVNQALASSQGSWGTSSSATARITVTILPRPQDGAGAPTEARTALRAHCGGSASLNGSGSLFRASLLDNSRGRPPADVERLLRSNCQGAARLPATRDFRDGSGNDQVTVLIAPI